MRRMILFLLVISATAAKAQSVFPGAYGMGNYRSGLADHQYMNDSSSKKNWSLMKYSSIMTSFSVFKGGSASMLSAPMGLQLNRRLTNNLSAFAGVSVAPTYLTINRSFMSNSFGKTGATGLFASPGNLGLNPRAELGLQYVNDERTFSISGSIGVQRGNYSMFPYGPMNAPAQMPMY